MKDPVGVIYILTNPSIPTYVKIGYADNVLERVKALNASDGLPFSFRIYATYAVSNRLADKKLHQIIDMLNPELRAIESQAGKTRTREFYAMSPEAAYNLLKGIAGINGDEDRLELWPQSEDDKENIANDQKAVNAKKRAEAFHFSYADIPVGSIIKFKDDESKIAEVISDRRVRYEGEEFYLSSLAQLLTGKDGALQGPLYFTYEGEILDMRRKRIMAEEDNK